MAEYQRVSTLKIARPDTPEGYMIINAADYRAGLPQEMYDLGLAYNPADWAPYVEPVLKAAASETAAPETAAPPRHAHASATSHSSAAEKK